MVSRRFMPPDSGSTLSCAPLGELGELEQLVGPGAHLGAGEAEVPPVDPEVLLDGEVLVEDVALRAHAEPGPDRRPVGGRVQPEDAVSSPSVTGETQPTMRIVLDLPAPLGPRKPKASPRRTVDVDAVDGGEVAEPLGQPPGAQQNVVAQSQAPR